LFRGSDSGSDSDSSSQPDKNTEVTSQADIESKELHFIKFYILDKLMDKPLGE